jgi:hypothetical protein
MIPRGTSALNRLFEIDDIVYCYAKKGSPDGILEWRFRPPEVWNVEYCL